MAIRVLDPTNEARLEAAALAPRLLDLRGKRIGIISNGKEGAKGYFRHLETMMKSELGAAEVVTRIKSNYSAPADAHIVAEIRQWDAVVSGIGD